MPYDVGAWFIAYLVHQKGEEVFITNFYKNLDVLGFEGSFQKLMVNHQRICG